ncbi:MAG: hypothetical protein FWC95_01065 [Defluviitaleaceae bacterium]|nr:hypothetical protein [Defluviitaleaceae bacterium]
MKKLNKQIATFIIVLLMALPVAVYLSAESGEGNVQEAIYECEHYFCCTDGVHGIVPFSGWCSNWIYSGIGGFVRCNQPINFACPRCRSGICPRCGCTNIDCNVWPRDISEEY